MNHVTLIGNVGQDPDLRHTQNGGAVLTLRLATTETFANKAGERQERTDWHTVKVWGARAEALHKIITKGRQLAIVGAIHYQDWEDKEGQKRRSTEILASDVHLLGARQS